jgi:hypothetical protein
MNLIVKKIVSFIITPLMFGTSLMCGSKNTPQNTSQNTSQNNSQNNSKDVPQKINKKDSTPVTSSADCDSSLWKHVWKPDRLEVHDWCKTVTGIIEEINAEDDGDTHMLLRLDKGQEKLVNKRNKKKKDGCLVIEAICVNNIYKKKAVLPCQGYVNNVLIPPQGSHVRVTGSYVNDTSNGWMEIHPISKLEIIN